MENLSNQPAEKITMKKLSSRPAPSAEAVFLRRVSYGIAPDGFYPDGDNRGDIAKFRAGGSSLSARINTWINAQLDTSALADKEVMDIANLIDPLSSGTENAYRTLGLTQRQEWEWYYLNLPPYERAEYYRPRYEHEYLSFNRMVYSRYQLFERLAYFWHNHFNINAGSARYVGSRWGTWDNTIRNGLLGNFYELLLSTAEHPAMLVYLDNYINTREDPNENYAREVFELHTLGAMNYSGIKEQDSVATFTSSDGVSAEWIGKPKTYVDEDVYEAARILTGWTFDSYRLNSAGQRVDKGEFLFKEENADDDQKYIMGHRYRARGAGSEYQHPRFGDSTISAVQKQGRHVLWKLATHPGTAKHIAWKLVRHFLDDDADKHSDVINAVAKTFLDNIDSPDQLKRCYLTLFKHTKLYSTTTWGSKKALPTEVLMQALRVTGCQRIFRDKKLNEDNNSPLYYQYSQSANLRYNLINCSHGLWAWGPPNGYPEEAGYWLSTDTLVKTAKYSSWLTAFEYKLDNNDTGDDDYSITAIYSLTQAAFPDANKQTPKALVKYWAERVWGFAPSDSQIQPILDFFCRPMDRHLSTTPPWPENFVISHNATIGIDSKSEPHYWRYKLRVMVALLLNHPYALLR